MKQSILQRLENLCERYDEIAALLSEPEVQNNQNKFRALKYWLLSSASKTCFVVYQP